MAKYTELEWNIGVQSPAAVDDVYEFRVYDGETLLDDYAEVPALTIGSIVLTPQSVYPDSDVTRVGWVNESAGTTNLWDSINETSTSDADYITVSV